MMSYKTALGLLLLAMVVMVAESEWGSDKGNSYSYDLSKMSDLRKLYNSKVFKAERMTRPLKGVTFQVGKLSHSGVRVTLEDGTKWLIHKGDGFGISSQTVVVAARHMSNTWTIVETKDFRGSKTVSDFVKAGGTDYKLLFDNCHDAADRMMEDLNRGSVSEPRTLSGRLFQSLGAKCEKALPPLVDFGILGATKCPVFCTYCENTVHVSYFTSLSRQNEFEINSDSVIPLFSATYALAINISVLSCLRLDCVRTKVWVALFGVLSAGMAVLASFGLLLFCGMPFAMTVASAPFLILGVGVDDMFIMISCWQKTEVHKAVEVRLAETYKEAGVSITITTLTDVLAFYIGLLTPFRSVQSFCMYTSTALLFCYIFNIIFFGACLALNGRREKGNRHWLTCMKVPEASGDAIACCVGGAYDRNTRKEFEMPMDSFFKNYYSPFLTRVWVKVLVCLIYAGYLAVGIYGCFQIQEGLDLKHLAVDGSYVGDYYDKEDEFFSDFGPNVMLVIKDEHFQYWNPTARESLDLCLENFQNLTLADSDLPPISWLHVYVQFGMNSSFDVDNETQFKSHLTAFLNYFGFSQDVNFTNNQIQASRMFVQSVNIRTAIDEKNMLNAFRETAVECGKLQTPIDLIVYHPAFIYFDQYAVIISNTIQNIVVATCVMLVISLLLIPNPLCSLWVTFSIASVIVGVAGFMALWDVSLDSVSMINLVICIGFSVDFSAHISYAFVSSEKTSVNEKATDAITKLGYPIVQGAVSTIAGVVVLAAAKSYIFRTFFKIMFLVILFGAVHGIVFIPVFLTFLSTCSNSRVKNKQYSDTNKPQRTVPVMDHAMKEGFTNPDCP